MLKPGGVPPHLMEALRRELFVTSQYVASPLLRTSEDALAATDALVAPWLGISLDVATRVAAARRIARTLPTLFAEPVPTLRALRTELEQLPISVRRMWALAVVTCALAAEVSFAEAVRLAVVDALTLARHEVERNHAGNYSPELAMVYDQLVLTSAYAAVCALEVHSSGDVPPTAAQVLLHALLSLDRSMAAE